jgi:serine/threonine protein kinase
VNPECWGRIKEIFEAALELEPAQRPAFLDRCCGDDPSLRAEVESLLASHDGAGDFIERPVYEVVPNLFEQGIADPMVGRQLGSYRIVEELGRGGMGIVYLAEDTRLGRRVAMKALAPELTKNKQHRERLRREAIILAALDHPGIATVFSLEEFDGTLYIVSEYVRGETLRTELARGPMPTEALLDTAVELAHILAAVHEQGAIHRDLKPENVKRTVDGRIKILDFGLARVEVDKSYPSPSDPKRTQPGSFLGTPAYASPEQIRGLEVDFRSDLFSLGVMLYELAAGVHPFGCKDSISTIARILERDPTDLTRVCPLSPPALDRIVRRCLSKNPAGRYSSARDLSGDLEKLRSEIKRTAPEGEMARQAPRLVPGSQPSGLSPLWWWQFHQLFVALSYYAMLYPLWRAREWTQEPWGSVFFFGALVAVGIAGNLRLHLWFTSRVYENQLAAQRRRTAPLICAADVLFVLILITAAYSIYGIHAFWAALHLGAAIGCVIGFLIIEPATTRAALGEGGISNRRDKPESDPATK